MKASSTFTHARVDRRQLLKLSVGAACSMVGFGVPWTRPGWAHAQSAQPDSGPGISIAVKYSMIRERVSVLEKFKILEAARFQGVEITVKEREKKNEILDAIQSTGVKVHGLTHGTSDEYTDAIDLCKEVGGDSVLIVAKLKDGVPYADNFKQAQGYVREAIPHAEKQGIRLLVENVRLSFLKKAEEMARFIDKLKSPVVGAYLDTGNAITWTDQSAEHWARVLGRRIVKLDIKDRGHPEFGDSAKRSADARSTDGGEVHWENVRKELARIGFRGWATAEVKGGTRDRLAGIARWMEQVLRVETKRSE